MKRIIYLHLLLIFVSCWTNNENEKNINNVEWNTNINQNFKKDLEENSKKDTTVLESNNIDDKDQNINSNKWTSTNNKSWWKIVEDWNYIFENIIPDDKNKVIINNTTNTTNTTNHNGNWILIDNTNSKDSFTIVDINSWVKFEKPKISILNSDFKTK